MLRERRLKILVRLNAVPFLLWGYRRIKKSGIWSLDRFMDLLRLMIPSCIRLGLPKDCFEVLPEIRSRQTEGRVILENQGSPAVLKDSVIELCQLEQHRSQPWPIFWGQFRNARLTGPSLALINNKKKICLESTYGNKYFRRDPAYNYFVRNSPTRLGGNWTSIISWWVPVSGEINFAHWFLDALPRMALLKEFPSDTKILVPGELMPFQIQTLEWLGVLERCRKTDERHLLIENYWFSSPPSMIVCYSPYAVNFLRNTFLPFAEENSETPKRFFLRRSGPLRNIANEEEILDFFERRSWTIIDAAQLTMAEQIQYFRQAEAVCGIHGAGFTNCVWCKPGCQVIELFADNYLSGCYEWICDVVQAKHHRRIFPSDALLNARIDLKLLESDLKCWNLI
jgi:hypothetical protein